MHSKLKISHNRHSGRLLPHEHTSYLPLVLLVIIIGSLLSAFSISAVSAGSPGPQSGSIGINGTMPSKPPNQAAVITVPTSQRHFGTSPITVSGSCPSGTLVEIYKNNIFAGSTPCDPSGSFSIQIDLLYGQNSLTAQVYDVLNQAGPVSNPVIVYYDALPLQSDPLSLLNLGGAQLLLITDAVYRGAFPTQTLNVPVTILGGTVPYAINVVWGDNTNTVIPRSDNSTFNAQHAYKKPGTYKLTLQGSDSQGRVAFLTVAVIVNGQPSAVSAANTSGLSKSGLYKLLALWPLFAILVTMVVSFWLGERREKRILTGAMPNPHLEFTTPHTP